MKVTQKRVDGDKVTLSAVASVEDVAKALQMAQEGFARSMGLQPEANKTPAQAAQEHLGIKDLDSVVADSALELLIPMALDKKNMIPSFMPEVKANNPLRRGSEFRFELEVTLKPEYELTSYDPVHLEVVPFEVKDSDVDAEIERMTGSFTAYVANTDVDPKRPVQSGDFIKIAIEASQDGELLKGLNTDGRTYAVGAGHMPPSFDEQIVGMLVGEEKEFDFTGPSFDPENPEVEDKVHAKVKVVELQREDKPNFDDAWVKVHMPMFKSADEMRANIRKNLEIQMRDSYDTYLRQEAVTAMVDRFEGKIEDEVYEAMMSQLKSNIMMEIQQQGKSWEEFVEQNGGESQVTMMLMFQARQIIVQGYVLDAVFRHFKLSVNKDDVERMCHNVNPNGDPRAMREAAEQAGQGFALREMTERFKANQFLVDEADISYIEQ